MSDSIKNISTEEEFKELLTINNKPVLVDFWATWCPPCRIMNPILNETADAHPEVIIAKIDVDKMPAISEAFGIHSIPTILTFTEGKLHNERIIGAVPPAMLKAHIEKVTS